MALPKIREQIEARVKDTGDTMTGRLVQTLNGNPYYELNDGTNRWFFQAIKADNASYIGPTSVKALKIDADGNATVRGSLTVDGSIIGSIQEAIKATQDGNGANIASTYLKLSGGTMTGPIDMNVGTGLSMAYESGKDTPWIYPKGATGYGIRYLEGTPDKMMISASGNNNTAGGSDLCINGNGDGTVTIRGNTILHAGNYNSYAPTKTGGGASGTWGISISGNAATATKLATARNIALGGNLSGSANFDGSGNITINGYNYSCSVNSGNTTNYPWHRIATTGPHTGSWVDKEVILMIRHYYNGGGVGVAKVGLRTNNVSAGETAAASVQWMYRYNIGCDALQMGLRNTAGNALADLYYKVTGGWARCEVYQLQGGRAWTLVSSSEASDTTTSDKKGSTEVYTSVADGGSKLSRGYTNTIVAVDGATSPISNGTSALTSGSSSLGTGNIYVQYE